MCPDQSVTYVTGLDLSAPAYRQAGSVFGFQFSAFSFQFSAFSFQFSAFSFQFSAFSFPLSALGIAWRLLVFFRGDAGSCGVK